MKTATTLFTLVMIALSSAAHMRRKTSLTTDVEIQLATTQTQTLLEPFYGVVSVGNSVPSISLGNQVGNFGINNFTLAFWFLTNGSSSLTDIIGNRQQPNKGNYVSVRLTTDGYVTVEISQDAAGTNSIAIQSNQSGLDDGIGHHFAVVRQGPQVTLYIDGVQNSQASSAATTNITGVYPFQVGQSYSGFSPLNISFNDLRIYNYALSSNQVAALLPKIAFPEY